MSTAKKTSPAPKAVTATRKAPVRQSAAPAPRKTSPAAKKADLPARAAKKSAASPAAAPQPDKAAKVKKPKLVRDSFTIPKAEYLVLDELKQRAAQLSRPVKKSELLRAGIKALAAMPGAAFLTALNNVPAIKTGRPTQSA